MNSMTSKLNIAILSDLHLGHKRNKASEIIKNLRIAFPDNSVTAELDIIFLAGDVFDDLLSFPDEAALDISIWIHSFLNICSKHSIAVRVLEGTPSHDWQQSEIFNTVATLSSNPVDLKYVKTLSIEYFDKFDINILYIPDEWNSSNDETLKQAQDLIKAKGLTQVDYAIMHGNFEYQMPPFIKAQKHSSEEYHKLVKELIFIGHVHTHTRNDRIVAQGSFDRLAHGEEGPKGHVRATIYSDGARDITFVENIGAKKFVTVNCIDLDTDDTLSKIKNTVITLPAGSFVRIEANFDNPIFSNMDLMIQLYPLFTWSKLVRETEEEKILVVEDTAVFIPITITRDNIVNLLLDRVMEAGADTAILTTAHALLLEVI